MSEQITHLAVADDMRLLALASPQVCEPIKRVLRERPLLSAHTLKPSEPDVDGWLDRLFEALQEFTVDLERYRRVLMEPDEALIRRAVTDVNFYDEEDPILVLLGELREGHTPSPEDLVRRSYVGDHASVYARMVGAAFGYVAMISAFWSARVDYALLHDMLRR